MKESLSHILLIEDDPIDITSIKKTFHKLAIHNPLHVAATAEEALALLQGIGQEALNPTPKIILLDLNLPHLSGLEFLKKLREDPKLKPSSVFVMTGSVAEQDIWNAYDLNVAGYIRKPVNHDSFLEIMTTLRSYWELIELPK